MSDKAKKTARYPSLAKFWKWYKALAKDYLEFIPKQENPRKYQMAVFLIHFSNMLSFLFCVCTPWAVISLYIFSRNYNSSWDMMVIAVFFAYSIAISIVISLIMFLGITITKKKKLFTVLLISFIICSTGGFAAYGIGSLQWSHDFQYCRNELNMVIEKLESYKKEHGTYPDTIDEVTEKSLILYRGFNPVEIKYKSEVNGFSITYYFGYGYTYDSSKKKWEGWD